MDQSMDQTTGRADRHPRWVAMWREAVRTSPLAIGLVELSTTRFVEMSDRAAGLLKTTPEKAAGLDYLSVTERPRESAQTFRLVRERMLDGIKGRRRFHQADGSMVELEVTGWAVRSSTGPDLGLWIASELADAEHTAGEEDVAAPEPWSLAGPDFEGAQLTLDDHWRIAHISSNASAVLGRPPAELFGSSIIELTHIGDLAALLLGFARATTDPRTDVRIRLQQDRRRRAIRAMITRLEGDGTVPFSLIVAPVAEPEAQEPGGASQLAGNLRRIASQIEAAGILAPLMQTAAALGVPATAELSPRQWEIASRLVQGDRVGTIAAEMFLSRSTVRNHLSAIFQKFGVHSQPELLALWRAAAQGKPPNG
jgi:DNA-binding CsgD family transcriptional regulator/PAS domain-containing protein